MCACKYEYIHAQLDRKLDILYIGIYRHVICKSTQFRFISSCLPVLGLNNEWTLPDIEIEHIPNICSMCSSEEFCSTSPNKHCYYWKYLTIQPWTSFLVSKLQFLTPHRQPWFHFKNGRASWKLFQNHSKQLGSGLFENQVQYIIFLLTVQIGRHTRITPFSDNPIVTAT